MDDICSFSSVNWWNHFIVGGYQMNQAWSALSVSKQFPVFHMFWCVFQENLPWFYWMCSEAVWLVVPRVFLFTFFQNEPDVFPVWGFTLLLRLLRYDWELLGHFQHQPIPSEPWDASQWVLWTDVLSGIKRSSTWASLRVEGTAVYSRSLEVQGTERCGKRDSYWKLKWKTVEYLSLLHIGFC